jgi:ABC-type branched-subunit amino acid transport system substrate-binding protein
LFGAGILFRANPLAVLLALFWLSPGVLAAPPLWLESDPDVSPIQIGLLQSSGAAVDEFAVGAAEAVAELNAEGGIDGRQVALVKLSSPRPWRDGAGETARLLLESSPVALIGPADRAGAHVAAQIATRWRRPLIALTPTQSLTRVKDPWIFRGIPDDGEQARVLLGWALPRPGGEEQVVLVIPEGKEGSERQSALERACRERGVTPAAVIRVGDHGAGSEHGMALIAKQPAPTFLLWLDVDPALGFLEALTAEVSAYSILASTRLDDPAFLERAGARAEGMALPKLRGALGYDMIRVVAAAARRAGPQPSLIRDELASGFRFDGQSGSFHFDQSGNRVGAIRVGVVRDGTLVIDQRSGGSVPK